AEAQPKAPVLSASGLAEAAFVSSSKGVDCGSPQLPKVCGITHECVRHVGMEWLFLDISQAIAS
ncbi:MAG: hypothetical protein ABSH05_12960, partial [Bryobacteraceae bacterium]